MSEYQNFRRSYRLAAGRAGQTGFEIGGETPVPLHITFALEKTDLETQNTGKVEVWNLNDKHLAILEQSNCVLSLRAGYGDRMNLIFAGIVSTVTTTMDNADRKTEIEVVDNLIQIRDTYVSVAYTGKVSWRTILDDVANQMGVVVSYSHNASFADIANGYSYVGQAKNILTKGCNCCGLSWSIQNGVLQVKKPGDVMSTEVYNLTPESGLLSIPSRVVVSEDQDTGTKEVGWEVEYFLNTAITVDDYVHLETKTVTGYFRVYSVQAEGDNQSGDWTCTAKLLEVSS